jgi:peptidyl-prolyl cis-trans isomerase C
MNFWMKWMREPLVHFVAAGLVLVALDSARNENEDGYRIVITPERETQLANRYALQFGAAPDASTLAQLVERDVHEEILYRQGVQLGIAKDDEIVRRRVVQKVQFLLQDLDAPAEPSDAQLNAYFATHAERYAAPARVTFQHVYFSVDAGEAPAHARAIKALSELTNGSNVVQSYGDPFPDLRHFSAYEPDQLHRLFGRTEITAATLSAPLERWAGPYKSVYGLHLIRVEARQQGRPQALAEVRERVRTDYLLDAQERENVAGFDELANAYTVVRAKS